MDAKIIPFPLPPPQPPETDVPYWASQAYKMLYLEAGLHKPDRMFVCYEENGTLYYLNLGYNSNTLEQATAAAIDHLDDTQFKR